LKAGAINGYWRTLQSLNDKIRDYTSVIDAHARAVSVKYSYNLDANTEFAVIIDKQGFSCAFALIITGPESDGIDALMNTPDSITGPVNLGNPGEFTMLELASKVIGFTKSSSLYIYDPLPKDDPQKRKPDISLANSLLNWKPKVMLDEGLKATIEYFQTIVPAQDSQKVPFMGKQ